MKPYRLVVLKMDNVLVREVFCKELSNLEEVLKVTDEIEWDFTRLNTYRLKGRTHETADI